MFAKAQDKESDVEGRIEDDDDVLALLQEKGDEGEAESINKQDDDYWLKKMAKTLISMGRLTTSMGGKMTSMSSTLIRDAKSMSTMAGQTKALGKSMLALGRKFFSPLALPWVDWCIKMSYNL